MAKQALAANQGTRFIQVTLGGWDMHVDIYGVAANKGKTNIFTLGNQFDAGVAALMGDLQAAGMLDSTLIVALGEFGRTPGFTAALGRDHYLNQFAFFAGGGVKGRPRPRGDRRDRREHPRHRVVAKSPGESGRHRGDDLLGDGDRLDDDLL